MGSSVRASIEGIERAKEAFHRTGRTQEYLAGGANCSRQTVWAFFARKSIRKCFFEEICTELNLDWKEIADFELEEEQLIKSPDINDNRAQPLEENTSDKEQNKTDEERAAYAVTGTVAKVDMPKLKAILALLQQITGDTSIEIVDIEQGSIKLILEGSKKSLELLESLFKSGKITKVEEISVENVQFVTAKALEPDQNIKEIQKTRLEFTLTGSITPEDIQELKAVFTEDSEAGYGNNIESQFNRLRILNHQAHQLLCRLGCYRYQDVPKLPKQGLVCLLWDVPQAKHNEVIQCLRDRALVEFCEGEYWLHPVIRAEATKRLRENPEWQIVNQKVAEFYSAMAGGVKNEFQVKAAFEAIEHFFEINNFEAAYKILMFNVLEIDKIENLALSENLWSNQGRILRICEQAIENLSDEQKVLMLIPMGYIYSARGIHSSFEIQRERLERHQNALDISQRILDITRQINPTPERLAFAEMSAYLIASKANRFIGKLEEALKASEQANKIAKRAGKPYGKALALYEIGLVYLEIGKPGRALRRIVAAAFQASTGNSIPRGVYQLSHPQISDLSYQIEHVFDKYNVNNEAYRKKKFAVLLNIARCLNLMKLYPLAKIILDIITQKFVMPIRPGTRTENCFLCLEFAIYYLAIGNENEAIKSYERARELSSHKDKGFRAFVLITFANWKYKLGQYMEALRMYREIEDMLKKEGSSLIKAQNHYQLSCTYLKCEPPDRENALDNLHKAEGICRELELPLLVEVMKLKEILEWQGEQ